MDIGIGAIIFIVFVIISIAQKIKERADLARVRRNLPRSMKPEVPPVREATPKSAPRQSEAGAAAKEIMEALFGAADRIDVVEEEPEWTPLTPDGRRELPQHVPASPPPIQRQVAARHVESRVQHDPDHEGATTREESIRHRQAQKAHKRQLVQQRGREAKIEQQPAREEGLRRRRTPKVRPTAPTPRQKRGRVFAGAHEVRKAIVFAEILGPPKAFEDR